MPLLNVADQPVKVLSSADFPSSDEFVKVPNLFGRHRRAGRLAPTIHRMKRIHPVKIIDRKFRNASGVHSDILEGKAGFGIQMVTTTGEFPMETDLLNDEWLMTAANGTIYTSERQDDAYAEPVINVYRLKESFIDKLEAE